MDLRIFSNITNQKAETPVTFFTSIRPFLCSLILKRNKRTSHHQHQQQPTHIEKYQKTHHLPFCSQTAFQFTKHTCMIGSMSRAPAFRRPSLHAARPAISNAITEESTSWYAPSTRTAFIPSTGNPASTPFVSTDSTPCSTEVWRGGGGGGMRCIFARRPSCNRQTVIYDTIFTIISTALDLIGLIHHITPSFLR